MELPENYMSNPLRSPDPTDQFDPHRLINESETGTRHPGRFETRTSIPNTQLVRLDAVRVYRNAALSVSTGNTISWDTVSLLQTGKNFDTTGLWNGSTTLKIPSTGKVTGSWRIKAQIVWPGTGAGTNRQIEIRRNGTVLTTFAGPATSTYMAISDEVYDPSNGDAFTITVVQDSGGALALTVGSDKCFFSMVHTG